MSGNLTFLNGSMRGQASQLGDVPLKIGRAADMDVVIPDGDARYVSRHHVTLTPSGGAWLVEDQGSTNGTFVNGARISRHILENGDTLRLGKTLQLKYATDDDATRVADADDFTRVAEQARPAPQPAGGRRGEPAAPAGASGGGRRVLIGLVGLVVVLGLGGVAWQSGLFARSPDVIFPELAAEYRESVFLVETGFTLNGNYIGLSTGTAFAAAEGGLLLTNKHVVQPHRYFAEPACWAEAFRRQGLNFADSLVVTVWPGGSVFRQEADEYGDRGMGYSMSTSTLEIAELGSDNALRPAEIDCSKFSEILQFRMRWSRHDQDNADLAVLRIDADPKPFPLAAAEPATNAPVMALGFPEGYDVLESNTADPVWRSGRVIRTQETIQTDAVVQGGNSGGPLVNMDGEVVGVITRGIDNVFNMALKIDYARILLERAR